MGRNSSKTISKWLTPIVCLSVCYEHWCKLCWKIKKVFHLNIWHKNSVHTLKEIPCINYGDFKSHKSTPFELADSWSIILYSPSLIMYRIQMNECQS